MFLQQNIHETVLSPYSCLQLRCTSSVITKCYKVQSYLTDTRTCNFTWHDYSSESNDQSQSAISQRIYCHQNQSALRYSKTVLIEEPERIICLVRMTPMIEYAYFFQVHFYTSCGCSVFGCLTTWKRPMLFDKTQMVTRWLHVTLWRGCCRWGLRNQVYKHLPLPYLLLIGSGDCHTTSPLLNNNRCCWGVLQIIFPFQEKQKHSDSRV